MAQQILRIQCWRKVHAHGRQLRVVTDKDHLLAVIVMVQIHELEQVGKQIARTKAEELRLLVDIRHHGRLIHDVHRIG
ncbi:hypothetical protein D9M70_454720 [compost metagenome]